MDAEKLADVIPISRHPEFKAATAPAAAHGPLDLTPLMRDVLRYIQDHPNKMLKYAFIAETLRVKTWEISKAIGTMQEHGILSPFQPFTISAPAAQELEKAKTP